LLAVAEVDDVSVAVADEPRQEADLRIGCGGGVDAGLRLVAVTAWTAMASFVPLVGDNPADLLSRTNIARF
jgi:hypothetical protein